MRKAIITFIALLILAAALSIYLIVPEGPEGIDLLKMNQTQRVEWYKYASNRERREVLTPQQYHVLVERNMEASFLGKYNNNKEEGNYYSAICSYHLFSSLHQVDGQSGYVEFTTINLSNVHFKEHPRTGQIEVYTTCGEYLGYVENNPALETGRQFIINSVALKFKK